MAQVTITINSREYVVGAEDGQEANILKLAGILDEKAKLITSSLGQVNENMLLAMVGLLVADELSETKKTDGNKFSKAENVVDYSALNQEDSKISEKIKDITAKINSIVKEL
ncbi:MAG: cell division protein ZapA [Lactobacillaceae bacterium]|jgi:cell division protein ZapA|nr:cell division protein ZapA [Lactobacillaceae bacterium]